MLAGTVCTRGEARAIVTHTGRNTRAARAAAAAAASAAAAGGARGVRGGSSGGSGSGLVDRARALLLLAGGGGGGGGGGVDFLHGQPVVRSGGGDGGGGTSKFDRVLTDITNALSAAGLLACFLTGVALMTWGGAGDDFFSVASFCVVLLVASAPIAARMMCATTMAVGCRQDSVDVARHVINARVEPLFFSLHPVTWRAMSAGPWVPRSGPAPRRGHAAVRGSGPGDDGRAVLRQNGHADDERDGAPGGARHGAGYGGLNHEFYSFLLVPGLLAK